VNANEILDSILEDIERKIVHYAFSTPNLDRNVVVSFLQGLHVDISYAKNRLDK